ncbi:hypothetical protein PUR50_30075, partial [Enterobacter hormaechei subsp. steigerwaltii]|nr:hypothetical protein [Enterobacter hormaechei subsp. steigerwaltii]
TLDSSIPLRRKFSRVASSLMYESSVKFLDSTADYPQQPGVVLIKVPKTLALLEQQLRALRKVVTPDT